LESDLDSQGPPGLCKDPIPKSLLKIKKVRLTEEHMSYEDLAVLQNFSDDEITFELNRRMIK